MFLTNRSLKIINRRHKVIRIMKKERRKIERVEFNHDKLFTRIRKRYRSVQRFCNKTDVMDYIPLMNKIHNRCPFKAPEILKLMEVLEISPNRIVEFFFTKRVCKEQTKV